MLVHPWILDIHLDHKRVNCVIRDSRIPGVNDTLVKGGGIVDEDLKALMVNWNLQSLMIRLHGECQACAFIKQCQRFSIIRSSPVSNILSMSPEERKEIAINNHIWSIVDIFNEDQVSKVRSYVESWIREIVWNEGNTLVDPEGWNMIDQDHFF